MQDLLRSTTALDLGVQGVGILAHKLHLQTLQDFRVS